MDFTGAVEQIKLEDFDTGLSVYRLLLPGQVLQMRQSLERMGQLQPVITVKAVTCISLSMALSVITPLSSRDCQDYLERF